MTAATSHVLSSLCALYAFENNGAELSAEQRAKLRYALATLRQTRPYAVCVVVNVGARVALQVTMHDERDGADALLYLS